MTSNRTRIIPAADVQHVESWRPGHLVQNRGAEPQQAVRALDMVELQERALAEARNEGHQQGLQEGYSAGEHWVQQESQRMWQLLTAAEQSLQNLQAQISEAALELAIDLARQILCQTLEVDRTVILPVVRQSIDVLLGTGQQPQLFISPKDAELVRRELREELLLHHWKVVEDPRISPGGCRIATAMGDVDAQIGTRWRRTLAALGKDLPLIVSAQSNDANAIEVDPMGSESNPMNAEGA